MGRRLIDIGVFEEEGNVDIILYEPDGRTIRGVIHSNDIPRYMPGFDQSGYVPEMHEPEEGEDMWNRR